MQMYVQANASGLFDIAVRTGHAFVCHEMARTTVPEKNSDVVRLRRLYVAYVDGQIERQVAITNGGEIETAILTSGAPHFVGGGHGDEVLTSVRYAVDGAEDIPDPGTGCSLVAIEQRSTLYRASTREPIAELCKIWTLTPGGLDLQQTVTWLDAVTVLYAYLTMLPIYRDQHGGMVTTGRRSPDFEVEDIAESGHEVTRTQSSEASTEGTAGVTSRVQILQGWNKPARAFFFSNSPEYAKLYFDFCGRYTTARGETWQVRARFDVRAAQVMP